MKKKIEAKDLQNSVNLLQPSRPIICTTKNEDGSDHAAPFSWINPVSMNPPRVGLALLNSPQKQHTLENIERTGEFVVNMPDLSMCDKLVECSFSRKFGENKFDRSGFIRLPSLVVEPPGIKECRAHLECKMINKLVTGDHTLIIADVVCARYDTEAYSQGMLINIKEFTPTIHVQNFMLPSSQLHVFLAPCGTHVIEVPYPTREDIKNRAGFTL
ncbi:MAG: flavin reductase family protein [Thermoanaerobacterales bacterium]|jgi:flavin reductase (DIM6/NTAB) family NADH-FMN oxidoreductase RutF|nr:flavin reductase family protein [Thermoanaerobacterales bacterium]